MASISIAYRIDKLNKGGVAPIHFRVIKGRKSNYVSSGLKVPKKYWDEKNKRIKPGYPNSAKANHLLYSRFKEATKKFLEIEGEKKGREVLAKTLNS